MKRQVLTIMMCLLMAMTLFSGCGKEGEQDAPVDDAKQRNAEAETAYLNFLAGEADVTAAESFGEDDGDGNYDGVLSGKYSYSELKAAIAEHEMHSAITKYTFFDFGQDGINELVVRFENTEPSLMNWTGIIRFSDGSLNLNYAYEDGYRTESALYDSGYLSVGGSFGAGASGYTVIGFDEKGFGADVFSENSYYGTFACDIAYDLQNEALSDSYDDIAGTSLFLVREYKADGSVKLSAGDWSGDASVRAREEALLNDLVALGAEQISQEEMDALCSAVPYKTKEVEWIDWSDGILSIDYAPEELLARPESFDEFIADDSEYQEKAVFSTDVTVSELRVLSLEIVDVNEEGEVTYRGEELFSQPELTPDKPLVVGMVFYDTPSMGISYVDKSGETRVYSINMSGKDSSLFLVEAELE